MSSHAVSLMSMGFHWVGLLESSKTGSRKLSWCSSHSLDTLHYSDVDLERRKITSAIVIIPGALVIAQPTCYSRHCHEHAPMKALRKFDGMRHVSLEMLSIRHKHDSDNRFNAQSRTRLPELVCMQRYQWQKSQSPCMEICSTCSCMRRTHLADYGTCMHYMLWHNF
jgi:hypothetical protein